MHASSALVQAIEPVRPSLEVADIFRTHGDAYRNKHSLTTVQLKAMKDIELCRTEALGGHVDVCEHGCGYMRISYNSCRNRNCPKCQSLQSAKWLEKRLQRMLPTKYFHVVVTLPHQLNPLVLQNQKILYNIFFHAVAQSLLKLSRDWERLQAHIGFTAVLHTWNQDMLFHPHLHLVVTAGGLDQSQTKWIPCRNKFLVPVRALSKKIRGKFIHYLRLARKQGTLRFSGTTESLNQQEVFDCFTSKLHKKKWVVYSKAPFGGPEQVFKYLSHYTHKVAISNHRLVQMDDQGVTFLARDNQDKAKKRSVIVSAEEFIRRFLMHVLPSGFMKIRHYGLMAPRNATTALEIARTLIESTHHKEPENISIADSIEPAKTWQDLYLRYTGIDITLCPHCGKGRLTRQPLSSLDPPSNHPFHPIFLDSS